MNSTSKGNENLVFPLADYLPNPAPEQPGHFDQQTEAVDIYLDDPTRFHDPDGAWEFARRLCISHARKAKE